MIDDLKNEYEIKGEYTEIKLKQRNGYRAVTLIDTEDLEFLIENYGSWNLAWNKGVNGYYVQNTKYFGIVDGKPKYTTLMLHKEIMGTKGLQRVDHINHDTLDNRKSNLRVLDDSNNAKNRGRLNSNNTTGYRNVTYDKYAGLYVVQLQVNKKSKVLGKFNDVHEAGEFAKKMREDIYGEYTSN